MPEAEAAALLAELDVQQHTLLLRLGERLAVAGGLVGSGSQDVEAAAMAGPGDRARGRVGNG